MKVCILKIPPSLRCNTDNGYLDNGICLKHKILWLDLYTRLYGKDTHETPLNDNPKSTQKHQLVHNPDTLQNIALSTIMMLIGYTQALNICECRKLQTVHTHDKCKNTFNRNVWSAHYNHDALEGRNLYYTYMIPSYAYMILSKYH